MRKVVNLFPQGDWEIKDVKAALPLLCDGEVSISPQAKSGTGALFFNGSGRFIKEINYLNLKAGQTYWVSGSVKFIKGDGAMLVAISKNFLEVLGAAALAPKVGNCKAGEWSNFKFKFTMGEGKILLALGKWKTRTPDSRPIWMSWS